MTSDGIILAVAFAGFIIFFILFSVLDRKWPTYPIYTIFSSFVLALLVSIMLSWILIHVLSFSFIALFLYSLLGLVYIFAVYINIDSSLHVRILQEVAKTGSKGLTHRDLLRTYNRQIILKKRLAWLINCRQIGITGNTYYLNRRYSLLLIREKFLVLLSKLYGRQEEFSILPRTRTVRGLLFLILLLALLVRLWGINFGLPYTYFVDEGYLIYSAFYLGSNLLKPIYYIYAPLVPALLLFEYVLYYIIGHVAGTFSNPSQFFISYLSDASMFFLIGRITMVIAGVAAVWLVFIVGKRFFNTRIGLLASFFLAFTFLHVKESHYVKQDVLMGFFVLAVFYFALKILQKGRMKDYLLGGVMFGLAMGTKYQAFLVLPVILLAHIFFTLSLRANEMSVAIPFTKRLLRVPTSRDPRNDKKIFYRHFLPKLVIFTLSSFFTFAVIHPYFILEPSATLLKTLANASGTLVFYPEHLQGKPVWWWYMFEHIPQGVGYLLFISSIIGFAVSFLRARSKISYLFIPLLPILFFVTIGVFTKMHYARYAVITLPFFTLSGAIFLDFVTGMVRNEKIRKILMIALAFLLISPSFLRTIKFDNLLTKPDTRSISKAWFEYVIPASSKVLVESMAKPEHPSNLNLTLNLDQQSIDERIKDAEERGLKATYLKSLKKANIAKMGYYIVATLQVDTKLDIFIDKSTHMKNVDYYVDSGVEYIVLTGWVQEKMSKEFAKSLHEHYRLIKEFRPTYEFAIDPHLIKMDYTALDKVDVFRKDVVFGPVIKVYKIRNPNFEIRNKLE